MKGLKKLLCVILSFAMVITSLTVVSIAGDGYTEVSTATEYHNAFAGTKKIRLMADITCTKQEVAAANEDVTVDLNGHTLTGYAGTRLYYTTQATAKFTIEDSVGTGKVVSNVGASTLNGGIANTAGSITVKGGTLVPSKTTGSGAAFYVSGASAVVTVTGGRFEDTSSGTALIYVNGAAKCYISGGYIGKDASNRSIWAYTKTGTKAQVHISGDPIITGTSWTYSYYFPTFTGGYYAKDMSGSITDKTNYKQITLPTAKEGCKYKVTKNNATIKYFDGDTEYTELGATPSAGTNSTVAAAQTKDGYNFVSWNTQADGEGDTYQAGAEFFVEGDLTLYAQWVSATATTYDIKYFDGDDEYTELAETVEEGEKFTIDDAQEKDGYIFKEWNTSKTGDGTSYAPGQEITASENLTLYAQWDNIVASVTIGTTTTNYATFAEALSAEIAGTAGGTEGTIKLMADLNVTDRINFSTDVVTAETIKRTTNFDLNGYTITSSSSSGFVSLNKYSKLNIMDSSSAGTGAVNMTVSASQLIYSPGWVGTQIKILGGSYSGAKKICNYANNSNNACRVYAGNFDVSPSGYTVAGESGFEKIGDRYYAGTTSVTVDGAKSVFASFEKARTYLVNNNDAGETGTIKLLANVAVSSRILLYKTWGKSNEKRTVIFDLNGFTLSSTKALDSGIITQNCYDVTYIKDTSTAKTGKITMYEGSGYYFHTPLYPSNMYYISDITMTGGSALGPAGALGSTSYYKIESGTYDFDPSPYMPDKTKTALDNGDGTWTIIDAPYIVTYSDETQEYFATYQLALDAILAKTDMTGTIKVAITSIDKTFALDTAGADITLDLNGQTVAMATNIPFASVTSGKLTITNGTINLEGKTDDAAKIAVAKEGTLCLDEVKFSGATTPVESAGIVLVDGVVTNTGIVNQTETTAVADTISGTISDEVKFTVRAYVSTTSSNAVVTMKYMTNGAEKTAVGTALGDGEYEFVTKAGMTLLYIDKDLEMTFYVDDVKASNAIEMSIQDYFDLVHEQDPDNNLQNAFMAETVDFGAKLQAYADENGISTAVLSDWMEDYIIKTAPTKADNRKAVLSGAVSPSTDKLIGIYVSVSDKVRLVLNYRVSADTKVNVTLGGNTVYEKKHSTSGEKSVALDKISPTQYNDDYIITFTDSNNQVLYKVRYSINSYAYLFSTKTDDPAKAVVDAMYCYGYAAEAIKLEEDVAFNDPSYIWSDYSKTCTATRVSLDGTITQTETVDVVQKTVTEGSGVIATKQQNTADFVNPAFPTQVTTAPKLKDANLLGSTTQTAYEKHLILNSDGSYGGSLDKDKYGTGAPKNGANDHVDAGYYAINDYYNTKCTDTRTILTGFKPYQQTMEYTDGIASVLMALNYCDDTFASNYTEKDLLDKYEELNGTTVYGNGTTGAGLKKLVENLGYSADTTAKATDKAAFQTLVENTLKDGKIMLLKWQQAEKSRWVVVVGFDGMGNAENNSDVLILGVPYDAYDHYQDGYQVQTITTFYAWWKDQKITGQPSSHDILIISPNEPITLQYETGADNIKTNPYTPERHLLLNSNGTTGGATNTSLYGSGTAYNGTYGGRYTDAPEYNYYGKKDYYNAVDTDTLTICEKFPVFQQTMASSCGISSTLNTLNYLGYDFTKLDNYVTDRPTQSGYEVGSIHTGGNYEKVQEALLNIYMQGDEYFDDASKTFNNYGGVGAYKLIRIGKKLGLTGSYDNFSVGSSASPKFTTFTSFKNYIEARLAANLPLIISWCPGSGHWETIIGYDNMGTSTVNDDVIVLADSADSHDQYQDGYNTYPARQFFAQWYNGTASLGQAMVAYDAIK